MKNALLLGVAALALAIVSPASAQPGWAGSVNGEFGNIAGAPYWNFDGAVQIPLDWNDLTVQVNGGAAGASVLHAYDGGGSLIWNAPDFRLAGTVIYNQINVAGLSLSETQLGVGGEWYPMPWLTLSAQGGGILGKADGGYVGGTAKGYIFPDLSVAGFVNYASLSKFGINFTETDFGAKAEWLPWESIPVGVTGDYTRVRLAAGGGSFSTDLWTVGLKLHLNEAGEIPLVQHDRTGTLDTIGGPISSSIGFVF